MTEAISQDLLNSLPSLKQKFVVDLVNGIDVARDHIKVQKSRDGFLVRLFDSLTGESNRRQNHVNEMLVTGLDSCFEWLGDLTEELTLTNNALIQVSNGLHRIKRDLTKVANYAADTREQLEQFQSQVGRSIGDLERAIRDVDTRQRAYQQMDSIFYSWEAGYFSSLSLAKCCFIVITELAWGVFGDYCKIATQSDRESILKDLRNRLIAQVNSEAGVNIDRRVDSLVWLDERPMKNSSELQYQEALTYLGDALKVELQPFTHFVLNVDHPRPNCVPFIMNAPRLIRGMSNELLKEGYLYAS